MTQHPFLPDIELTPYWPANGPIMGSAEIVDDAKEGWALIMSPTGAMGIWPTAFQDEMPVPYQAVFITDTADVLHKFLVMFCRRGYEKDDLLVHQDGQVWIFNWRSFTDWQYGLARMIAHLFIQDKVNEAWTLGRWAQDQIHAAENYRPGGAA